MRYFALNIRMRQNDKYQGQNKITKKYRQLIKITRQEYVKINIKKTIDNKLFIF